MPDITGSETTVLYRTETLKKIPGYPVIYGYDSFHSDTSLAYVLLNISDLAFVFQVLSYTRRHEGTFTVSTSAKFRTYLNLHENELFKYKQIYPELEKEYQKARYKYGLFLLEKYIKRDKECLKWHKKHMDNSRRFTFGEFISIIIKNIGLKFHRLIS